MTVTRTRLDKCSTADCPWKDDEEMHEPWCREIPGVEHLAPGTHQHWPKTGMGGRNAKSKIVAILCWPCHDRIDNGTSWGNAVAELPNGERWYQIWDLHGEILFEKQIGASSDGPDAHAGVGPASVSGKGPSPDASVRTAPEPPRDAGSASRIGFAVTSFEGSPPSIADSDFERWMQQGETLRHAIHSTPWAFGDWAVVGEDHFGEQAWNEISKGFDRRDYQKVRNWIWVARSISPSERFDTLSWSHHRAVAHLPTVERTELLRRAAEEGLDRDGLAGLLPANETATAVARTVRYSVDDLRERLAAWPGEQAVRNNARRWTEAFLESLEAT